MIAEIQREGEPHAEKTESRRSNPLCRHVFGDGNRIKAADHATSAFSPSGGHGVGEIGHELEIPSSTLSHHLEKLKNEDLVNVRREGTFLCHSANTGSLQKLLGFLYAECCTRNKAIDPGKIFVCK